MSGEAIDTCTRFYPPGWWARHAGKVMRVRGRPVRSEVAASASLMAADRVGVGQGTVLLNPGNSGNAPRNNRVGAERRGGHPTGGCGIREMRKHSIF